jgi:hypothetical protein
MSATLYLSPTTGAILAHISDHVRLVHREHPLAPLTFLLPSGDAIRQLRRVLGNVIGVRFLQFYNLSAAVLSEAGSATHEMSDLATRRLVRGILGEMSRRGELSTFAVVLDKPGFIDVLVEWLREMKTQGITSEAVSSHAAQTGKPRDLQLARLYARYQAALRQVDCADADGLLWLAAEALEQHSSLLASAGEVILAGFDQFSPVQLRMVTALANRAPLTVYMLWDERRPPDSLALSRLAPTRDALRQALFPREVPLAYVDQCGPALAHARRSLFEAGANAAVDPAGCVTAVAAPSAEAEVRCALRRIKQLLLDGVQPEQIALLAPQPGTYRAIVTAVGHEYGVPVACETSLGENPCVAALLSLLALTPTFPWRQTFDALRSPYIKQSWLDAGQITCLDALTRERPVIAGQDQWWYALGRAATPADAEAEPAEDEDRGEPPLLDRLDRDVVAAVRAGLAAFFAHLTPPPTARHAAYVAWIQDALLGLAPEAGPDGEEAEAPPASLHIAEAAAEGEWAERDLLALHRMLQALRTWLDAVAFSGELGFNSLQFARPPNPGSAGKPDLTITWEGFASELLDWLPAVPVQPDPRQGAIRFGPLEASRAVAVDHLFVLGLGEGEFPRPPQGDPLYTAAERLSHPLPLVRASSAEDASLWWQVLSNCSCSLTLLRSRFDANGAEWLPSAYWTAVVDLVAGLAGRIEQPRLSARPGLAEAACHAELLEALALSHAPDAPAELVGPWASVQEARAVAAVRDGGAPLAAHEGVIGNDDVKAHLRRRYGPGRSWSISRLNRYGACPYAFWAHQALQLEALADPAEGLDALQRGSLVHKLLEKLFAHLQREGIAPEPSAAEQIRALLDRVCEEVLPHAAERYGFRPGPLWEHEQAELRAELQAYMAWECEPKQAGAFRPFAQELQFGMGAPGARPEPVIVPGLEGAGIALRGVVDRIDSDGAGHLRVIDYKTGSKAFKDDDILAGRALQSALYAWVVETLLPGEGVVVDACYRHTGARKESGRIACSTACADDRVSMAAAKAVQMAGAVLEGWFPPAPSRGSAAGACDEKCDYLGLCRVTRHGVRKAQRAGLPLAGGIGEAASGGEAGHGGGAQ